MKLDMRHVSVGVATGFLLVSAALACGDKLVALGGGVPFNRIGQGPPGNVVLYLNPETRLNSAVAEIRLDDALKRAGHSVRTVGSRADLDRALLEAKVDVVLMDWADALSLDARLTDKVTTLPVFYGGASGEFARLDTQDRCVLDADKKRAMKLFRAVNRIVYDHAKGQPVDCAQIGGRGVT